MMQLCPAHRPSRRRPGAAGFTLIELIVTMGIMLFVLSVTVIAFTPVFRASGLRSASRIVAAALDGARVRAIQQRRQVRFEAQRIPDAPREQWRVTSSAGDLDQEWKNLPEFVLVRTNVTSPGSEGTAESFVSNLRRLSITYGPDGSVVRCRYTTGSTSTKTPTGPFAVVVENVREAGTTGDVSRAWLVIIPLTGATEVPE